MFKLIDGAFHIKPAAARIAVDLQGDLTPFQKCDSVEIFMFCLFVSRSTTATNLVRSSMFSYLLWKSARGLSFFTEACCQKQWLKRWLEHWTGIQDQKHNYVKKKKKMWATSFDNLIFNTVINVQWLTCRLNNALTECGLHLRAAEI